MFGFAANNPGHSRPTALSKVRVRALRALIVK